MASFALSPTCALDSVVAFTYVPIPPFHKSSTGARKIALITSAGVSVTVDASSPSRSRACGEIGTAFNARE